MYVYIYVYIDEYVYICMYACIHVYIYIYVYRICVYICIYIQYVYVYIIHGIVTIMDTVCVSLVWQGGFVVTMAPMQTYLDPTTSDLYTRIQ